jgi:hypothetical protein
MAYSNTPTLRFENSGQILLASMRLRAGATVVAILVIFNVVLMQIGLVLSGARKLMGGDLTIIFNFKLG